MKTFKEHEIEEALVSGDRHIVSAIMDKLLDYFSDGLKKGDERKLAQLNQIGKLVNMGVTKKKQAKGRAFLYKLKK